LALGIPNSASSAMTRRPQFERKLISHWNTLSTAAGRFHNLQSAKVSKSNPLMNSAQTESF
jgi:hypothetical protein